MHAKMSLVNISKGHRDSGWIWKLLREDVDSLVTWRSTQWFSRPTPPLETSLLLLQEKSEFEDPDLGANSTKGCHHSKLFNCEAVALFLAAKEAMGNELLSLVASKAVLKSEGKHPLEPHLLPAPKTSIMKTLQLKP